MLPSRASTGRTILLPGALFAGRTILVPGALFAGALALRTWALNWGLPFVEHPDEPALLEVAIRMVQDRDPNPRWFLYPSLFFYLLAAVIRLHLWWGMHQGWYVAITDLPLKHYQFTTTPQLFVWARLIGGLLGSATVPALYLLGRRMFDLRTGLVAALALLVAPFHVAHSHYVTTDVSTGLWVVLAALAAWQVTTTGHWRGYLWAGILAGLAAGTKYNGGSVVLALPVAHLLFWRRHSFGPSLLRLVAGGGTALLTFLLTTPYALLDWPSFVEGLRFSAAHYAQGQHGDFVGRWQLGEYGIFLWREALFPPGLILALAAPLLVLRRCPRQLALLLAIVGVGLFMLLISQVNFVRNLLPIFPLLTLLAAVGALRLADGLRSTRLHWPVTVVLVAAVLLPLVRDSIWQLGYWSRPHTMQLAAEHVRSLPQGMRMAVELYAIQWAGAPHVFPATQLIERTPDWYRANGFRYLVANDDFQSPMDQAAYQQLRRDARVLVEYPKRRAGLQPGPGGAVLDLGEHLAEMRFVRRSLHFGDQLALLGYEMQPGALRERISPLEGADVRQLAPGQSLQINLYWRALRRPDRDYTLFVHVLDRGGNRVAQRDLPLRYGDYPSSRWRPDELVIDRADFHLPALPPGNYQLMLGLYDAATLVVLPAGSDNTSLATITVQ